MSVLLVEDNPGDVRLIEEYLKSAPRITAQVTSAPRLSDALAALDNEHRFDVALVDLGLPDSDGARTVDVLLSLHPELPVVVLTGREDDELALRAVRAGAQDYIVKSDLERTGLSVALRYARERHEVLNQIRRMSFVDPLTALYNRRGLETFGGQILRIADREGRPAVAVFADLDDLKVINDRHGHAAGDRVLKDAAETLRSVCRAADVLARVGGDEFVVLALVDSREAVSDLLDRVSTAVAQQNGDLDDGSELSMSLGSTVYEPESGTSLEALIEMADEAMYQAKQRRKERMP